MRIHILILLLIVSGVLTACGKQKKAGEGMLNNRPPGPPMQQVQTVLIKTDSLPLPGKAAPANGVVAWTITEGSAVFQGEISSQKGQLVQNGNAYQFTGENGRVFNLGFNTPAALNVAKIDPTSATLRLKNRTGPIGADQFISLSAKNYLLSGYVWKTGEKPVSVTFDHGFLITQEEITEAARQKKGYTTVKFFLNSPRGKQELTEGKAVELVKDNKIYICLPEISVYHKPDDPGEDGEEGYILKASIFLKNSQ